MKPSILKTMTGGIVATLVMSMVSMVAPLMGLPKMGPPQMLSIMLGLPIEMGWVMHFMIGIVFAIVYAQLIFAKLHKVNGWALKGLIFGIGVFLFAQVMMIIMGAMMPMPKMVGSMMLAMLGSLVGHLVYGLIVGILVNEKRPSLSLA